MTKTELETLEIRLLIEAIYCRYGYDFRNYAQASLKRRILHRVGLEKLDCIAEMLPKLLHDEAFFSQFLMDMSITVTEMFRDVDFYTVLRTQIIPVLKSYPYVKIWHAGCATGEEVYSLAILLQEEGFYDRCQIYATDFNVDAIRTAREGVYSIEDIERYEHQYMLSGGKQSLLEHFHHKYHFAKINPALQKNITFSHHNLVCDGVFGEMQLVLCRNVLIYFNKTLQDRVLQLFWDSLCANGFLALGIKETIEFSNVESQFQTFDDKVKIYRKRDELVCV